MFNMIELGVIQLVRLKYSVGTFRADLTVTVKLSVSHFILWQRVGPMGIRSVFPSFEMTVIQGFKRTPDGDRGPRPGP